MGLSIAVFSKMTKNQNRKNRWNEPNPAWGAPDLNKPEETMGPEGGLHQYAGSLPAPCAVALSGAAAVRALLSELSCLFDHCCGLACNKAAVYW